MNTDFALALKFARLAILTDSATEAKTFHGLARFYWARCNASE